METGKPAMNLLFLQESPMYEALGIHSLTGAVKASGHACDLLIESEELEKFIPSIVQSEPDLIAFSFMTRQQEWAIHTINKLRRITDVPILIGGTHPTMYPETLGHCEADFLCVGEGEYPIVDLLDAMAEGRRTDDIPNIHAKVGGQLIKNEIRTLMHDWDELAMPDREIYSRYPFLQALPLKRFITSFGCAYRCSFCYINNYREIYSGKGKFFRRKSVERVIREMKAVRERYPMKRIHFVDDIFSLDRRWVENFLPVYRREIGLPWSANIWIDHMDEAFVKLFKESGCAGLTFGVEAGDQKTRLELIDKNLPDETYVRNCGYLKKHGIPFHTGNIIGLPGQGLEEAYQTARFNRRIGATSTRAGLFWPFPGTRLTQYAIEHGMLSSDYSVEYFNRGIYPKVKHDQVEELTIMVNIFQLVAKWRWFEALSRLFMTRPKSLVVRTIAKLVDQSFWFHEAKFFGLLNLSGVRYFLHLRGSLAALRRHEADPRFKEDAAGQRPFWNMSKKDLKRVYAADRSKDGIT